MNLCSAIGSKRVDQVPEVCHGTHEEFRHLASWMCQSLRIGTAHVNSLCAAEPGFERHPTLCAEVILQLQYQLDWGLSKLCTAHVLRCHSFDAMLVCRGVPCQLFTSSLWCLCPQPVLTGMAVPELADHRQGLVVTSSGGMPCKCWKEGSI